MNLKKILIMCGLLFFLIPAFGSEAQKGIDPKDVKEGRKIFDRLISAMGGREKLEKIANFYNKLEIVRTLTNPTRQVNQKAEMWVEYSDKMKYQIIVYGKIIYTVLIIINGDKGWGMSPPENKMQQMEPDMVKENFASVQRDYIYALKNLDKFTISFAGKNVFGGKESIDLFFTGPQTFHAHIDPKTYIILGISYMSPSMESKGDVKFEEIYSDYRDVDGIRTPFTNTVKVDGQVYQDITLKEVKFNIKLEEDFFNVKL
jgi:hypothetical protein